MRNPIHKLLRAAVMGLVLILTGCHDKGDTLYHGYLSVPLQGWNNRDTLTFCPDTVLLAGTYQFELGVRTTAKYNKKSLFVTVERQYENPSFSQCDTVECVLADSIDHATEGIFLYQYKVDLAPQELHKGQYCRIHVAHCMRNETVEGVSDVGLRIYR